METGQKPIIFEYYENMYKIMDKDPCIEPIALASLTKLAEHSSLQLLSRTKKTEIEDALVGIYVCLQTCIYLLSL